MDAATVAPSGLLRLVIVGSVDDGKSTLLGRLLHDCQAVPLDQLESLRQAARQAGEPQVDLALLTDGLRAEREQRITIDVAYRHFATPRRRFILADTPGHEMFTRNMVTGASTADLAVLLIDAARGVQPQTYRHASLAARLGIRQIVAAINKMDQVGWSADLFAAIETELRQYAAGLGVPAFDALPVSALQGDNVVTASAQLAWFTGPTLLHYLETVEPPPVPAQPVRLPVQLVVRPTSDYRGYAGTLEAGSLRPGDCVAVQPLGQQTTVRDLLVAGQPAAEAVAGQAVVVRLHDELDIARGNLLSDPAAPATVTDELDATLVWLDERPLQVGRSYLLKHTTTTVRGRVTVVRHRLDPGTLAQQPAASLQLNDIGLVHLRLLRPICADRYAAQRRTGGFILIDPDTNATAAAGLIEDWPDPAHRAANLTLHSGRVTPDDRARMLGQQPFTLWLTGLSGSGKSTVAYALEDRLVAQGQPCIVLDGDNIRHGLNRDLGFSPADRSENIRRIAEVARLFNEAGLLVITAFISPYLADRAMARQVIGADRFVETWVAAPLEECERRDPKGLYVKARAGQIPEFTGVSAPYEAPVAADLCLNSDQFTVSELVDQAWSHLRARGAFAAPH
ncbi:MAG: adenylyl-sulfate kinase [Fimbriimonadaceae bacterium]|nr:adenylyl-sulfate kinase [Fimbriimonadaceae bacterium]